MGHYHDDDLALTTNNSPSDKLKSSVHFFHCHLSSTFRIHLGASSWCLCLSRELGSYLTLVDPPDCRRTVDKWPEIEY